MVTLKDSEILLNFWDPPLSALRRKENILLAGYFDDLITLSKNFRYIFDNVFKTVKTFNSLGFVIQPGKPAFILWQVIEYLGFSRDLVTMGVSLTELKQKLWVALCHTLHEKSRYSKLFWSAFFPDFPAFWLNAER